MGSSSWLFSNSRSSATLSVQQLPLFSNSRCSATPSIEQLPLLNNSLFSNSLCSATQCSQQLSLFSNSIYSATLSVQQLFLFSISGVQKLFQFGNTVCSATPSVHHAITSPPSASRPSCFCASRRAPRRRQAGPVPGGDEGFRAHSAILRAAR